MLNDSKHMSYGFRRHSAIHDITGWTFLIFYEVFFVTFLVNSNAETHILSDYILPYAVNIALFYLHSKLIMPLCFNISQRRYALLALLLFLELTTYLILINFINTSVGGEASFFPHEFSKEAFLPMLRQLWRGIYFVALSTVYWKISSTSEYQRTILEMEKLQIINLAQKSKLEKNLVEVQNAYLQSQINPHLLFNTLNFIYNNVEQASPKASEAVILLSELMNYSLREQEADGKSNLDREITQINNLIRINRIRFDNNLFLDVEMSGDFEEARIIPLAILVFVENLFKHGDLTDPTMPGKISIVLEGNRLDMSTFNKKKNRVHVPGHGTGLINIRKRLSTAYKNAYTLTTKDDDSQFYVHLMLNL